MLLATEYKRVTELKPGDTVVTADSGGLLIDVVAVVRPAWKTGVHYDECFALTPDGRQVRRPARDEQYPPRSRVRVLML